MSYSNAGESTVRETPSGNRRLARMLMLGVAAVCMLAFVAVQGGATDSSLDRLEASVTDLPLAPIAARTDATAVWTGKEMIVWGGRAGDQNNSVVFSDGAAYDPSAKQWRSIPAAPLEGRYGHIGVWTGSEMIIWGGSRLDRANPEVFDGASYDVASNQWRSIARAPEGRSAAKAVLAGDRLVVGSGTTPAVSPRSTSVLIYDTRADVWKTVAISDDPVFDFSVYRNSVISLGVPSQGASISLVATDLDTGQRSFIQEPIPNLPNERPLRTGVAIDNDRLIVASTYADRTVVAQGGLQLTPARVDWSESRSIDENEFAAPADVFGVSAAGQLHVTAQRLLSLSPQGVGSYDLRTHETSILQQSTLPNGFCFDSAASAWTAANELIAWGGHSCTPSGPYDNASGVQVVLR